MNMKPMLFPLLICSLFSLSVESNIPQPIERKILNHIKTNTWNACYYDVMPKVVNDKKFTTFLEIGVALGGHAETLLQNTDVEYFGIDPYQYDYDPLDGFNIDVKSYSRSKKANFDYLFKWVKDVRLSSYGDRVHLLRKTSHEASEMFEDESLDCVFIDGDHRYSAVLQDLEDWYQKVRSGGILAGDDYWMKSVSIAVDQFFSSKPEQLQFFTSKSGYKIFYIEKL